MTRMVVLYQNLFLWDLSGSPLSFGEYLFDIYYVPDTRHHAKHEEFSNKNNKH